MGDKRVAYRVLVGKPRVNSSLRRHDTGVDDRIILRWIFRKWDGGCTGMVWLRTVTGGGLL
jgi:hypothetical protein